MSFLKIAYNVDVYVIEVSTQQFFLIVYTNRATAQFNKIKTYNSR